MQVEVADVGELRVGGILEQVLYVGDPLALARGVSGVFDRAEFGDHHMFGRVLEAKVANRFDDRPRGRPCVIDAGSTFVPVEDIGSYSFDPLIARVPPVGVASVGDW